MWKNGRQANILSPWPFSGSGMLETVFEPSQVKFPPSLTQICWTLEAMLWCDSITPFGVPVVPDEYTKKATSVLGVIFAFRYRDVPLRLRMLVQCFTRPLGSRSS